MENASSIILLQWTAILVVHLSAADLGEAWPINAVLYVPCRLNVILNPLARAVMCNCINAPIAGRESRYGRMKDLGKGTYET